MRKILASLLLGCIFLSCEKKDPKEQLKHLSGYWEIDKVEFSNDSVKEYTMSPYIDYLEFNNDKGFRRKVKPKFDGTSIAAGTTEEIEAIVENDSLRLYYKTPYAIWMETVISAEEDKMRILNPEGVIYHYNKYQPINISTNEEAEQ
ncbi:lipocalin family protein [Salegentibacter sp. F188]|uniref:Lipocalin family protein n=1 Tax=Autumnicola patrickiae TaxID=3075591 RepID=A0ABU3DXA4_9FLAO|nr:lipocalin family protein [Salegentibacter sp. F188]MDT0688358.1 lipocalin family protein [Salegentibacter sp. F188]